MSGPSWLVDSKRIATKIKSASSNYEAERVKWKSNPCRSCPNCQHTIDNSDVAQEWPGLPRGVKFDPSDQEIIWHLLAKAGEGDAKPHPFINEFIPTVDEIDGICYVHPKKLPGVKQDGNVAHFFHRAIKAYSTGTRKRRKIQDEDNDVRWHKTGRTKPVLLDGLQRGCKKIMVLYMSASRGGKTEKTNWVMHQYHLGTEEEEKDNEYVISKIFYQQNQVKQGDKTDQDASDAVTAKVDPVTPKSVTPDPPRGEKRNSDEEMGVETAAASADTFTQFDGIECLEDEIVADCENPGLDGQPKEENQLEDNLRINENNGIEYLEDETVTDCENPVLDDQPKEENPLEDDLGINENNVGSNLEEPKWWDSESQNLLNSQQLVEGLSLCDDLLLSQSPSRDVDPLENGQPRSERPKLADYAHLGSENLKKDLEACQNLVFDPTNIELDTPPDFRLSQLDFGSQESFLAWGSKLSD